MSETVYPEQEAPEPEALTKPESPAAEEPTKPELDQLVLHVKAKRWLTYRRYFDLTTDEIMGDSFCLLVVAANEHGRSETKDARHPDGRDQMDRFMDMTMTELSEYVGLTAPKSGTDLSGAGGPDQSAPVEDPLR